ncbi:MAG: GH3 auxin-responsive promoter family protein [Bacteroidales bacterium]|nr:GH3 auxin-responsive promoter family protein [Bacteroidales bacterium]
MPFNSLINKIMLRRIPAIENFMKNPTDTQHKVFQYLIDSAKDTVWGKYFDYKSINDGQTFAQRIPINTYEDLQPFFSRILKGEQNVLWSGDIKWFSKSSGTTSSRSKYIPVSKECLEECHYKGGKDMLALYCNNHPDSGIFSGSQLALGGSPQPDSNISDIFLGDVSAILIDNLPLWAEFYRTPKKDIALLSDWEEKLDKMVKHVSNENVTSLSGVPSWMLVLLEKLIAYTNRNICDVWPDLEAYFHGGVSFKPYAKQFAELLPSKVDYMETYNASEGFFGLQDQSDNSSLLLLLDYGIYYEFIDFDTFTSVSDVHSSFLKAVSLSEVELNKNYVMLISTNSGLWRYVIGDTVLFTQKNPYRFKITGRTKNYINICGEEVIVNNSDKAVSIAARAVNASVKDYTAAPFIDKDNNIMYHQWIVEFNQEPDSMTKFSEILDESLRNVNSDYDAKRYKNFVLQPPAVIKAPQDTFYNWLKLHGKLGGQHKIPRLSNNRDFIEELLHIINN